MKIKIELLNVGVGIWFWVMTKDGKRVATSTQHWRTKEKARRAALELCGSIVSQHWDEDEGEPR